MKLISSSSRKLVRLAFIVIAVFSVLSLDISSKAESREKISNPADSNTENWSKKAAEFLKKRREKEVSSSNNHNQDAVATEQASNSQNKIVKPKNPFIMTNGNKIKKKATKRRNGLKHKQTRPMKVTSRDNTSTRSSDTSWMYDILHKIYIRADYGISKPQAILSEHFKKKSMYGAGIGYRFNQVFRADISFQHRTLAAKPRTLQTFSKVNHYSVFLNNYLNLMDQESYIIPFITVGVGYSKNTIKDFTNTFNTTSIATQKNTTNSLAWNAGVGAVLKLTKNFAIEASYKYVDVGDVKVYTMVTSPTGSAQRNQKKRVKMHEVSGGVVINF